MVEEIVLEVRCMGCGRLVQPSDINWLMFRTSGIPVHNLTRCSNRAYKKLYPSIIPPTPKARRSRKAVVNPQENS